MGRECNVVESGELVVAPNVVGLLDSNVGFETRPFIGLDVRPDNEFWRTDALRPVGKVRSLIAY